MTCLSFALATRRALERRLATRVPGLRGRVPLELEDVRLEADGNRLVVILRARGSATKYGFRVPACEAGGPAEWTPEEWADVLVEGVVEEVEAVDRGLPVDAAGDIVWID